MTNAILTIAIPTFNENLKLELQIERLLNQCNNLPVKIKIFDNNPFSDFNLKKDQIESFDYIKNPYNLGGDWNIFSCLLNCDTEYLWILSTNDLIKIDSVEVVLNEISIAKKNECFFVHMGQSQRFFTTGIKEFVNNIVYEDSFSISRCLYNTNKLKNNFLDFYNNIQSNQGQAYLIFAFLIENAGSKCYFTDFDPIENYFPAEWSKIRFINNTLNIIIQYRNLFQDDKELYNIIKNKIQKMLFFQLFISRSYQKMNLFYFSFYFIRISLLNLRATSKRHYINYMYSFFDFEYIKKQRKTNMKVTGEDDFKSY
jgi:hypothetical protein